MFEDFNGSSEAPVPTNNLYATASLNNTYGANDEKSIKLSQTYDSTYVWPNICHNLNRNQQYCSFYGTKSSTGLTWNLGYKGSLLRNKLIFNQNYLITFQYKGLANFIHPTTTTIINGQTTTPSNQVGWGLFKDPQLFQNVPLWNYLSIPAVGSSNLIKPGINYTEWTQYFGNFKYDSTLNGFNTLYFSIFIGQNNIPENPGYIDIDSVAITKCQNIRPDGSYCGDGIRQQEHGENCDATSTPELIPWHSSQYNQYGCSSECQRTTGGWCGNGILDYPYELCDRYTVAETHETNSTHQYICTMSQNNNRCASTTDGWCGDGIIQLNVNGWARERCDHNSNPTHSTTPYMSRLTYQYECPASSNCLTSGGYCGNGDVEEAHGELYDCGNNKKCCLHNGSRWTNCIEDYSTCGDGDHNSCFEECDYTNYSPPTHRNSQYSIQYNCSNQCKDIGGYCGDGFLQDGSYWTPEQTSIDPLTGEGIDYGEQCDYNMNLPNWNTSTQICNEDCQIQNRNNPSSEIEWINVPGNPELTTNNFQVMADTARILGHYSDGIFKPICDPNKNNCIITTLTTPYNYIYYQQFRDIAISACENIGARLINNNEWMTIVKNGENIDSNWTGGSVGSGQIRSSLILSNGQIVRNLGLYQESINNSLSYEDLPKINNPSSSGWFQYDQLVNYGSLGSLGLLPGNSNTSTWISYGSIYLPNSSSQPFDFYRGTFMYPGVLTLSFNQSLPSTSRFRCVKD